MGVGDQFSKFLKAELDCRAVWPPVLTPMQLGDYGVTDGAGFHKLGNIRDFGLVLEVERGKQSSLNLVSSGVRQTRLSAGVAVPAFQGLGDVAASLGLEFSRAEGFVLKCRQVERTQISNLGALALRLGRARTADGQGWRHVAWKIVWQLYTGCDVVFLATRSSGTRVEFTGKADALHQLEMGSLSAGVGMQASHSLGVEILGDTGPVGYGLARIKVIGGGVKFFAGDLAEEEAEAIEQLGNDDDALPASEDDITTDVASEDDITPDEPVADDDEPAPWDALEGEETDPRDLPDGPLMFADEPIDTSSFERWLQGCLRRLVDPDLVVDGALGLRTRRALKTFQRQTDRLQPDGVAGPRTIAALAARTGTDCPRTIAALATVEPEAEPSVEPPPPRPEPGAGELQLRTQMHAGAIQQIVASADDEVRFSYFSKADPWCVSSYHGGKTGLVRDEDLRALGYPPGAIKILRANALKESRGLFGAVNTWDDQLVSWGVSQFAGRAGTLAALLAALHEDPASRPAFDRFFTAQGMSVAHGPYLGRRTPAGEKHTGWHLVVTTSASTLRGDDAWAHVRSQPRLVGAFMLAGNDRAVQLGQIKFWMEHFLERAVRKVVVRAPQGDRRICDFITSEYGLALIVRLYNWMPAYVQPWFLEFAGELGKRHPELEVLAPETWARWPELEAEFCEILKDKRRRVKRGSYDTYALELERSRGSYALTGPTQEKS